MSNLMDTKEAAQYLKMHPNSLRDLCKLNKIPHVNLNQDGRSNYRFVLEDLKKWIDSNKKGG